MSNRIKGRRYYKGILAEPMMSVEPLPSLSMDLPPGVPQPMAESWKNYVIGLRQDYNQRQSNVLRGYAQRVIALWEHLDLDRKQSGWERDWALSLARRHEPDIWRGSTVHFSDLFRRYDVNDMSPTGDVELAIKLAFAHIPGFQFRSPKVPKTIRLNLLEIMTLMIAYYFVRESLRNEGRRGSDREVAAIWMCPKQLSSRVPLFLAHNITQIILTHGNRRRLRKGPLSNKALRKYISEIRTVAIDIFKGTATPFQIQVWCRAWPLFDRMANEED